MVSVSYIIEDYATRDSNKDLIYGFIYHTIENDYAFTFVAVKLHCLFVNTWL
jgi:hypothetical protein